MPIFCPSYCLTVEIWLNVPVDSNYPLSWVASQSESCEIMRMCHLLLIGPETKQFNVWASHPKRYAAKWPPCEYGLWGDRMKHITHCTQKRAWTQRWALCLVWNALEHYFIIKWLREKTSRMQSKWLVQKSCSGPAIKSQTQMRAGSCVGNILEYQPTQ